MWKDLLLPQIQWLNCILVIIFFVKKEIKESFCEMGISGWSDT